MKYKPTIITSNDKARHLRRNGTPAEIKLWQYLRNRMLGVKFRRQCPVGPYILDFYSSDVKLCIELDGTVHDSLNAHSYDSYRTQYLNGLGITVLRFDNSIVFDCIDGVIESIHHFINNPKHIPGDCINLLL